MKKNGSLLMAWWDGDAAARVLAYDGDALLLERAEGKSTLLDMALHGKDDEASSIMCKVAAQLHAPRNKPLPSLVPLTQWFQALEPAAAKYGGIFTYSAAVARELLARHRIWSYCMATSTMAISSILAHAAGSPSIPKACSVSAAERVLRRAQRSGAS